jgi:succinoglycan biosynthesis protein ExoM
MPPDVSVCIATFRRPEGLARLLESLARLKLPTGLVVEIVVVDNDAAGGAREAAAAAAPLPESVRWFVEPEPNIAVARNRAVDEARGRWVAFVDDDEVVDENWLAAFWRQLERDGGDGLFGPVLPRLERVVTPWLELDAFYAQPRHASGSLLEGSQTFTNNALVRGSLCRAHRFDPAWGRTGGSDVECLGRMRAAGARFRWCDEAIVHELVPPARHRLGWLTQRAFRGGVGHTRLQRRGAPGAACSRGLPRALLALGALLPLLPVSMLGGRATAARVWLRICVQLGHLWAFAGLSYEEYAPRRRPASDPPSSAG